MAYCNPELASLITETLGGDKWITEAYQLEGLRKHASDKKFQAKWRDVKLAKKERLAGKIKVSLQILINCSCAVLPSSAALQVSAKRYLCCACLFQMRHGLLTSQV